MRTSTVSLSCTRCVPSEGIPTMALFLCRRLKLMGTHSRSLTTTLLKRALNQGTLHPPPTPTLARAQENTATTAARGGCVFQEVAFRHGAHDDLRRYGDVGACDRGGGCHSTV